MKMDINFEDLNKDQGIIDQLERINNSVNHIEDILKSVNDPEIYNELSKNDKIKYNLLMSFSLNSLIWMHLRLEGINPKRQRIMSENDRLKKAMFRAKEINNKKSKIRLNKETAQRFIRSGLWQPRTANTFEETEEKTWDCP
ncbi:nuclear nucleic acid-binding protein C1D-like [Leptopilina boulardi]|uniref:nuclear nucleic acid-binding protein C1D-like n=1 Tax=Leptopilina boulardi TaxID=63433 RepID=UPI0021F541C5|nr:nuclear nucleic acid-binding protein C1D-like [Leptopilina boulardi]XP_051173377.1 nuclear nucleic acid-binding protein C1D-like [Leptopilina boulardi]XP_051173378.1 nuclear nucleic acid-binding protein C1D-like [Leptopilina boulardi]XP_051173379.1 nuclear nucleic acid-binding protein C1D-like [Leptopilina boulardi]XP_051173380.1 nuclear nucleic acid-binding protein C1D-like [Leptopilina boulardi]